MRRQRVGGILSVVFGIVLGTALGLPSLAAAHGGDKTVVHVCIMRAGVPRFVPPTRGCLPGETATHWSIASGAGDNPGLGIQAVFDALGRKVGNILDADVPTVGLKVGNVEFTVIVSTFSPVTFECRATITSAPTPEACHRFVGEFRPTFSPRLRSFSAAWFASTDCSGQAFLETEPTPEPAAGATVSGTTQVRGVSAGGAPGPLTFTLSFSGPSTVAAMSQTVTGNVTLFVWDTTGLTNGTYTVTLTVTDAAGASATTTRSVTVSNTTATPTPTPSPLIVSFGGIGGGGVGFPPLDRNPLARSLFVPIHQQRLVPPLLPTALIPNGPGSVPPTFVKDSAGHLVPASDGFAAVSSRGIIVPGRIAYVPDLTAAPQSMVPRSYIQVEDGMCRAVGSLPGDNVARQLAPATTVDLTPVFNPPFTLR